MAPRKGHKDVEFVVDIHGEERIYRTLDEAAAAALVEALARGRTSIDVLVHSEAGARFYGGGDGVAVYEDDPEASVFERIEVRASSVGRVP